jgi:hypothetical protein
LPPGFDLAPELRKCLEEVGAVLRSETDEQGLQVAMVSAERHHLVGLHEVTICGYFRPHRLELGSCGAHFVGVNARKLPWTWNGRSGEEYAHAFWHSSRPAVCERIGIDAARWTPAA